MTKESSGGAVQCPVLRSYKCPVCVWGDRAHTVSYCPRKRKEKDSVRPANPTPTFIISEDLSLRNSYCLASLQTIIAHNNKQFVCKKYIFKIFTIWIKCISYIFKGILGKNNLFVQFKNLS